MKKYFDKWDKAFKEAAADMPLAPTSKQDTPNKQPKKPKYPRAEISPAVTAACNFMIL